MAPWREQPAGTARGGGRALSPSPLLPVTYVLPLLWRSDQGIDGLAAYLREISREVEEVIVVDGSPPDRFQVHAKALGRCCRHVPPDPRFAFLMGKVNGVTTGVLAARRERVVIADDDVRYDRDALARVSEMLAAADLVRPQNHFDPLPWHARLDTARTLLNRVFTGDLEFPVGDFPGTLALRRSSFVAVGGYDGDVMFENLELMRTVAAAGGAVATPLDLYVRRLPPSTSQFRSQRVRQAYDDFGVPARMTAFLAVAPAAAALAARRNWGALALGAASVIGIAEVGRRRADGGRVFPVGSSLFAPLWVAERSTSAWLAVRSRVIRGGIPYAGSVIPRSVSGRAALRRRVGGRLANGPAGGLESDDLVRPVAERVNARPAAPADGDRAPA